MAWSADVVSRVRGGCDGSQLLVVLVVVSTDVEVARWWDEIGAVDCSYDVSGLDGECLGSGDAGYCDVYGLA